MPWKANQGPPVLRGQALPNPITQAPLKDVIEVREMTANAQVYKQDFESDLLHFLPSWQDFLTNHVSTHIADITEKIQVYLDLFYRTAIFHASPSMWICGKATETTSVTHYQDQNIALAKDANVLQALIAELGGGGGDSTLGIQTLRKLASVMFNDIAITPFTGGILPDGSNGDALKYKYCLVCGSEVYEALNDDAQTLGYKDDKRDVITSAFQGTPVGRFTCLMERFEMRIAADGTIPAPEAIQENPNFGDGAGETIMNQAYVDAPYGVAFACGGESYKGLSIGPPPADWNNMTMKKFASLNWNGKVEMTQNVMIPCLDGAGNATTDTNKRGEMLQLIAALAMGIIPIRRRNIIPILYTRRRPGTTS
jgi:hypothetical protein